MVAAPALQFPAELEENRSVGLDQLPGLLLQVFDVFRTGIVQAGVTLVHLKVQTTKLNPGQPLEHMDGAVALSVGDHAQQGQALEG